VKDTWLDLAKVREVTGLSSTWLRKLVTEGKIITRETGARGRNGRVHKEYLAESLPTDARAKLAGGDAATKSAQGTAITLAPLFAGLISQPTQRVALVDPRDVAKAAKRLAIIAPLLAYIAAAPESDERKRYLQCATSDGQTVTTADRLATYLGELHNVNRATLWRWTSAYKKNGGEVALADKRRADKGQSRFARKYPELAVIAAYQTLDPDAPTSATVAYEEVCAYAAQAGIPAPSRETIRVFLKQGISPGLRTLALEGKEKYQERFSPFTRRGYTDISSNEIWVSDHAISDVLVQDDIFNRDLKPMRMHMTTLQDLRSRYVVGVSWSQNGSSRSIVTAFRHAVAAHGLPHGFYCDNGKDFRKVAKGATPQELAERARVAEQMPQTRELLGDGKVTGIFARFNIPVTYCIPYSPQSKPIERYHRTFHERFDKCFFTYTGGSPELRPDRTHAAAAEHHGLIMLRKKGVMDSQQVAATSMLPLASGYISAFMTWVRDWYHVTPQRGIGMDGRCPAEVFLVERHKPLRTAPPAEQMAALLLERKRVKVSRCSVSLLNRRYVYAPGDVTAKHIMHHHTTKYVFVAYDPFDTERVAVLDADGFILCWLQPEVMMRQSSDAETRVLIAETMADRRGLTKDTYQSQQALRAAYAATGHKSQAEHLREVARLPLAAGDTITQRAQRVDLRPSAGSHAPESSAQIAKDIYRRLNGN
jgi:hypothetical protein